MTRLHKPWPFYHYIQISNAEPNTNLHHFFTGEPSYQWWVHLQIVINILYRHQKYSLRPWIKQTYIIKHNTLLYKISAPSGNMIWITLPLMLVKIYKLNLKMELVQDPKNKKDERQRPFGSKREKSKTVNSLRIICCINIKVYQCRFNQ